MASTITALTGGGGVAVAGDTSGVLELKTNNGTTALTLDTSQNATVAGNVVSSSFNSASTFGFKNRIINGAMMIDQRNAGASVSVINNGAYFVDRFYTNTNTVNKLTAQQNAGSVTPPVGFRTYFGYTSTSAYSSGSTDYFQLGQHIEGYNTADFNFGSANASTITLSFWVRSSLTGTFAGAVRNAPTYDRTYIFTYTISSANTWEYKTITISGDTTGTWNGATNSIGLNIVWDLGSGSSFNGTANTWQSGSNWKVAGTQSVVGTNGATFYITGVQLEKGSTATSFDYRPYGTEFMLCQRYYETVNVAATGAAYTSMTTTARYSVVKRATPTLTRLSNWNSGSESGTLVGINEVAQLSLYNPTTSAQGVGGQYTSSAEL